MEMQLGPFIDLVQLSKEEPDTSTFTYQMRAASIISGIPYEIVEAMHPLQFEALVQLCTIEPLAMKDEITEEQAGINERKDPVRFIVDGVEYKFDPDYAFTSVGIVSKVEDLIGDRPMMENLHYLLALCAYSEGEKLDLKNIGKKAERMCRAKVSDVIYPLFFWSKRGNRSSVLTRLLSRAGSNQHQEKQPR